MTLAAPIRRSSLALAALFAMATLAAPALAGNRTPSGGCDEPQPKPKSGASLENASPTNASGARRENTSIGPSDESGYVPLSRAAPPSVAPAPRPAEAAPAPAGTSRTEKPKAVVRRLDAPVAPGTRAKKPAPAKVSIPNLPATPGMGTLLRVGITAGREIS